MAEAAVHSLLEVQAEHVVEVRPVQVRIHPEHLAEDGLASLAEVLGKAASFPNPIAAGLGKRRAEGRVVGEGDAGWIRREERAIVDLRRDVPLDEREILVRGDLYRLQLGVQPGEAVIPVISVSPREPLEYSKYAIAPEPLTALPTSWGTFAGCKLTCHHPLCRERAG